MRVLLKALGTGNSSPGRGQNTSRFPKVDSQAMFGPWDQPHHSEPAWPHGGHIKAKHQAISGTSPLQVSDGNASGRSGDDGPNLLPSGSWSPASPGQTAPSVVWGWLMDTKSVFSLTRQTERQIADHRFPKDSPPTPLMEKPSREKSIPQPLNLPSVRVGGCQAESLTEAPIT
ncbi:unnamed protein product [Rangifer tarandus platyrhynchus]|uniref:Uncharacterized protein n=1 Tax=Rangifer tarandus platyrhynchus TaxID=3082113 RepID=A0AC59ZMZ5_RANTA